MLCIFTNCFCSATLFVSSLPYTATSVDLQTLFSDIAPVRSAFIVTQPGTGVSKGVGYVAFAIKEDAQAAFDKISKEGITLAGRNLRVQWADQKVSFIHCILIYPDRLAAQRRCRTTREKDSQRADTTSSTSPPKSSCHPYNCRQWHPFVCRLQGNIMEKVSQVSRCRKCRMACRRLRRSVDLP